MTQVLSSDSTGDLLGGHSDVSTPCWHPASPSLQRPRVPSLPSRAHGAQRSPRCLTATWGQALGRGPRRHKLVLSWRSPRSPLWVPFSACVSLSFLLSVLRHPPHTHVHTISQSRAHMQSCPVGRAGAGETCSVIRPVRAKPDM